MLRRRWSWSPLAMPSHLCAPGSGPQHDRGHEDIPRSATPRKAGRRMAGGGGVASARRRPGRCRTGLSAGAAGLGRLAARQPAAAVRAADHALLDVVDLGEPRPRRAPAGRGPSGCQRAQMTAIARERSPPTIRPTWARKSLSRTSARAAPRGIPVSRHSVGVRTSTISNSPAAARALETVKVLPRARTATQCEFSRCLDMLSSLAIETIADEITTMAERRYQEVHSRSQVIAASAVSGRLCVRAQCGACDRCVRRHAGPAGAGIRAHRSEPERRPAGVRPGAAAEAVSVRLPAPGTQLAPARSRDRIATWK